MGGTICPNLSSLDILVLAWEQKIKVHLRGILENEKNYVWYPTLKIHFQFHKCPYVSSEKSIKKLLTPLHRALDKSTCSFWQIQTYIMTNQYEAYDIRTNNDDKSQWSWWQIQMKIVTNPREEKGKNKHQHGD